MLLVDTNIILELMLQQEKSDECEKFLNSVATGDIEATITRFSMHAIQAILKNPEHTSVNIHNVNTSIGLKVYDTNTSDEIAIALLMKEVKLDFDDTLQFYVAKRIGAEGIVSFDKDFDKVDINRLEPAQV
ncbi:MAG: PIN domain-containing protein [Candidatus Thermoplasmatota archaeon]|nr:PIN domain-containing protein [Candidatus Thermoplasmatota archaeon]